MKVYNYNAHTKAYTFEEDADPDPMRPGRWLIPAHSTIIKPPEVSDNEVACFNEDSKAWLTVHKDVIIKQSIVPYNILRSREYPSIFEYIDGVVKNDYEQINKYIKACLEVKARYPKPKTIINYEI